MGIQLWVAVYAAILSTAVAGWNILARYLDTKIKIEITSLLTLVATPIPKEVQIWGPFKKQAERTTPISFIIELDIENLTCKEIYLTDICFKCVEESGSETTWFLSTLTTTPILLRPGCSLLLDEFDLPGYSPDIPLTFTVHVSGTKRTFSGSIHPEKDSVTMVSSEVLENLLEELKKLRSVETNPKKRKEIDSMLDRFRTKRSIEIGSGEPASENG